MTDSAKTTPSTIGEAIITAEALRGSAENISHSNREINPTGDLLDAADEIDRLNKNIDGWVKIVEALKHGR